MAQSGERQVGGQLLHQAVNEAARCDRLHGGEGLDMSRRSVRGGVVRVKDTHCGEHSSYLPLFSVLLQSISNAKYFAKFDKYSHFAPPPQISRNCGRKSDPPKFRKKIREILAWGNPRLMRSSFRPKMCDAHADFSTVPGTVDALHRARPYDPIA